MGIGGLAAGSVGWEVEAYSLRRAEWPRRRRHQEPQHCQEYALPAGDAVVDGSDEEAGCWRNGGGDRLNSSWGGFDDGLGGGGPPGDEQVWSIADADDTAEEDYDGNYGEFRLDPAEVLIMANTYEEIGEACTLATLADGALIGEENITSAEIEEVKRVALEWI